MKAQYRRKAAYYGRPRRFFYVCLRFSTHTAVLSVLKNRRLGHYIPCPAVNGFYSASSAYPLPTVSAVARAEV